MTSVGGFSYTAHIIITSFWQRRSAPLLQVLFFLVILLFSQPFLFISILFGRVCCLLVLKRCLKIDSSTLDEKISFISLVCLFSVYIIYFSFNGL